MIENRNVEFTETTHAHKNVNLDENCLKAVLCFLECLQSERYFQSHHCLKSSSAVLGSCNLHLHVFSCAMLPCPIQMNVMDHCNYYLVNRLNIDIEDFISNMIKENKDEKNMHEM